MAGRQQHDPMTVDGRWAFLRETLDLNGFLEQCETAHAKMPEQIDHALHYAEALGMAGRIDEKFRLLRALLHRDPAHQQTNLSLGLELMREGRYAEGWPHYDVRHASQRVSAKSAELSETHRWRGEVLPGQRVLLLKEQGLGDTLQFVRFALNLASTGTLVALDVQGPLRPFLAGNPWLGTVMTPERPAQINRWTYLTDLVPQYAPTAGDVAWPGTYLSPPAVTAPIPAIARSGKIRVGLAWQGSKTNFSDFSRSVPLAALVPFREAGTCSFFSLGMPEHNAEIAELGFEDWIADLTEQTSPFENLAAAIAQLDLVVTVCTSVAHLAGAMGKPVWTMLNAAPDWRWGRKGGTTPWYPSMRLYRQTRYGQWTDVIERVAEDLRGL